MRERVLLGNVAVVAACALVYELLCGTLASYLLGDAVRQFAIVLGLYLFAMGVGAWLSKRLERAAAARYVQAEIVLALVGGLSTPLVLLAVAAHLPLRPALYGMVGLVGVLVGLELPLLIAIARAGDREPSRSRFGDLVANALAFDYAGALVASLLFPLVFVPHLGLVRTSAVAGALNVVAAASATSVLGLERSSRLSARAAAGAVLAVLAFAFVRGESWVATATD
jgi:spermidine synthase